MLSWTVAFLVIALIAAAFGFSGIASTAASFAKILFVIFLVLFVISIIAGGGVSVAASEGAIQLAGMMHGGAPGVPM